MHHVYREMCENFLRPVINIDKACALFIGCVQWFSKIAAHRVDVQQTQETEELLLHALYDWIELERERHVTATEAYSFAQYDQRRCTVDLGRNTLGLRLLHGNRKRKWDVGLRRRHRWTTPNTAAFTRL